MPEEMLEVVDEKGTVLRTEERGVVSKKGLLHRAVYVAIANFSGEVLLQKRGASKRAYPNRWDIIVLEHPHPGESYEAAAHRGALEELGISEIQLREISPPRVYPNNHTKWQHPELAPIYFGTYDGPVIVDGDEVSEARFFPTNEIDYMALYEKEGTTGWFREIWAILKENISKPDPSK